MPTQRRPLGPARGREVGGKRLAESFDDVGALNAPHDSKYNLLEAIQAKGVPCSTGICPEIYREKAFQDRGHAPAKRLPNAKQFGETSLMFLVHPTLEKEHMHKVADQVEGVLKGATR